MSGHNKWSKIKNKKAVTDAAKSKIFSKMAKLISTASKEAGGDTSSPVLRAAIEKARSYNMPASNIERAVKKGVSKDAERLESITYEAYGPSGSALVIEVLTDNRNRAAQEVKTILTKNGASLAAPGAATWAFSKDESGWIPNTTISLSEKDGEALESLMIELEENDDVQDVFTNAE